MPWIAAGGAVLGGLLSSSGSKSAAKAQAAATREATELQREQYAQTREDLSQYRNYGSAATNKLMQLLGLEVPVTTTVDGLTREQLRAQLLPQFTSKAAAPAATGWSPFPAASGVAGGYTREGNAEGGEVYWGGAAQPQDVVDEAGLNAAIDRQFAEAQARADAARQSPEFGSLLKDFSLADFQADPSYEFRRTEGMRGLENSAASRGNLLSGAAMKALTRYNSDLASQEYGNAFQRDAAQKAAKYNFLAGGVGTGQNSAAMTGQAGAHMAESVSKNTTAMGTAMGASQIASSNALASAVTGGTAAYQQGNRLNQLATQQGEQNALMRTILGGNSGWGGGEAWRTTGSGMPDWYNN